MLSQSPVLLLFMLSLWMLQTSLPVFQPYLPLIHLSWQNAPLQIPLSQVLTSVVGLLCCVFSYCLLHECSGGRVSLATNLQFLLAAYAIIYGHGMHAVCVMVEEKGADHISSSMAAFVNFLHRFTSHNMFVFGLYALLMVIVRAERDGVEYRLQKEFEHLDLSSEVNADGEKGSISNDQITPVKILNGKILNGEILNGNSKILNSKVASTSNGDIPNGKATPSSQRPLPNNKMAMSCKNVGASRHSLPSHVVTVLLHWMWPTLVGAYFSIFAHMTGTVPITLLFYASVYTYSIFNYQQLRIPIRSFPVVWVTVAKAACIGLPTTALMWFWTSHH